jgi:hypothetical protein
MSQIVLSGDTSGAITLAAPSVAGTNTISLPAATGTVMVSGNMPAFSAYVSSSTSVANAVPTKIIYATKDFDTNNNYNTALSRFTPTVAGYYYITGYCYIGAPIGVSNPTMSIYKNGSAFASQIHTNPSGAYDLSGISSLVYCNGSTDYIEIYLNQDTGSAINTYSPASGAKFSGFMVRGA